jgi:hypothetical protein
MFGIERGLPPLNFFSNQTKDFKISGDHNCVFYTQVVPPILNRLVGFQYYIHKYMKNLLKKFRTSEFRNISRKLHVI